VSAQARQFAPATEAAAHDRPEPPTRELAAIAGTYATAVAVASFLARDRELPQIGPWDLAVLGLATHKVSRRISKDSVTSPFRVPFAEIRGPEGSGEVKQRVRGRGFRRAIGELVTCPFCVGQWVATGFVFGLVFAPRATRLGAGLFATAAVADFLQFAYATAEQAAEG
jgi:Protein of unknown function (DUF1360)